MSNVWSTWKAGDLLWSPGGEGEWCELYAITSTASWSYFQSSNGTTHAGPKDLTLYPPSAHRSLGDRPPKP